MFITWVTQYNFDWVNEIRQMSCKANEYEVNHTDMKYQGPSGLHERDRSLILSDMVLKHSFKASKA